MTKSRLTTALLIGAAAFPAAANAQPDGVSYQDLRSPDARDAALAAERSRSESPPVATVERVDDASDGFDWGDAGIGATAMLGLLAIGSGAFMVLGGGSAIAMRHRARRSAVGS